MKCPMCEEEEQRSTVTIGAVFSTCMYNAPFYDEDGRYHNHDPNSSTQHFSCSRGHDFSKSLTSPCPSCDFGKQAVA